MDLNHKNIYLSWTLVQIYTFNREITPICAHIWRHISYCAGERFPLLGRLKICYEITTNDHVQLLSQCWWIEKICQSRMGNIPTEFGHHSQGVS